MNVKKTSPIHELIEIYADGPTLEEISAMDRSIVCGFTFNPTLFRKLGVTDYLEHSKKLVRVCESLPLSLEVLADDEEGMVRQARMLSAFGDNVYVKIPIMFTSGKSTFDVVKTLSGDQVKLNITAVFTDEQVAHILPALGDSNSIISVFAGRIYDLGLDAAARTKKIASRVHAESNCKVLWASPRMVCDAKTAYDVGCDIITMQAGLIKKLSLFEKTPNEYSLDTVRMFFEDAVSSGYKI